MKHTGVAIALLLTMLAGVAPARADSPGNPTLLDVQGTHPTITPDGAAVVYLAPYGAGWESALYAVPVTGGNPIELSGGLSDGQDVERYWVAPDSSHVVYMLRDPTSDIRGLYSVPPSGGTPAALHPPLNSGDGIGNVEISPDSAYVVFTTRIRPAWRSEVFSIPIAGGSLVRLSPPLGETWDGGGGLRRISPDSTTVVLTSRNPDTQLAELLATPIATRSLTKLAEHPIRIGHVHLSPDSALVVFSEGEDSNDILSVPLDGSQPPTKLAGPISDAEGSNFLFSISHDSRWVVIQRFPRQDPPLLSSVSIHGGEENDLGLFPPGRIGPGRYTVTADSRYVLYVGSIYEGSPELFREAIDGGGPEMLTVGPGDGDDVSPWFTLAHTSEFVAYTARAGTAEQWDVFTIAVTGGEARRLTHGFDGGYRALERPLISADLSRIVVAARSNSDNTWDLFAVPTSAGTTVKLNGPQHLRFDEGRSSVAITPDSSRVIYVGEPSGIYSVPIGVRCGPGFASIVGTSGDDILIGTPADDVIHARGGNDTVRGRGGDDVICAGRGDDMIFGGRGADEINGGRGADTIWGRRGNDTLRGGWGPDDLDGGRGVDNCSGGPGLNTLRRCE